MKKAIVFGASGFVGSYLLKALLDDPDYEQVTIVVRKVINVQHPKLKTVTGDFHSLPDLASEINADDVFITLGTTKKKTPDQKAYREIDHDYPVLAAQLALKNGAKSVFLLTAVGSDAGSGVFYIRTKGETERDILALDFEHTHIFRPSLITGDRAEKRILEKIFIGIWPVVDTMLFGSWKKYKGIHAKDIALAMKNAAKVQKHKVKIYEWDDMQRLLH